MWLDVTLPYVNHNFSGIVFARAISDKDLMLARLDKSSIHENVSLRPWLELWRIEHVIRRRTCVCGICGHIHFHNLV